MKTKKLFVMAMTLLAIISIAVGTASASTDEYDVVMAAAIANNGAVPSGLYFGGGNPLYVDLRTADEYCTGHVPGAINVPYRTLGDANVLAGLSSDLAAHVAAGGDNLVIVYGNTHHYMPFSSYLSIQGFPVKYLHMGMARWTKNEIVAPGRYKRCTSFDANGKGIAPAGCSTNDFATTTDDPVNADDLSGEGRPDIECIAGTAGSGDLAEIARCMFDARYAGDTPDHRMTAGELWDILNDGDSSNDPFVLSNRGTDWGDCTQGVYYWGGHIPGAVAVDWCQFVGGSKVRQELRALERTDFMPTDKLVVHHCWVGWSQQYGMLWYDLLGYTVTSLDHGMNDWTDDNYVRQAVIKPRKWYTNDWPVESCGGANIGPSTLNTKSKGDYVTVMITIDNPAYDTGDVDLNSIRLEGSLTGSASVESADKIKVKFDRADVIGLPGVSPGSATLTVSYDMDGTPFVASDTIKVL